MWNPEHLPISEALAEVAARVSLAEGRLNPLYLALEHGEIRVWTQEPVLEGAYLKERAPYFFRASRWDDRKTERDSRNNNTSWSFPISYNEIYIRRIDLDRLWPVGAADTADTTARIRKKTYDWEGALIHLARLVYLGDLEPETATQTEAKERMCLWFIATRGTHPDEREVRRMAKRFLDELKRDEPGGEA